MDPFKVQYLLQVKKFVFIFFALYALILLNGCDQRDRSKSKAKLLDNIEAQMFQEPENLDSLLAQVDTTGITPHEQARMNTIRGLVQFEQGKFDMCIKNLEKAETFFLSEEDQYHSTINKLIRAFVFERLELPDDAARLYMECEKYFANYHLDKFKFYASLGLLRLSEHLKLDKNTRFRRLRQEAKQLKDPVYEGLLYAAMGAIEAIEENDSLKSIYYEQAKTNFIKEQRWSAVYATELNILFIKIRQDPSERTQIYYDHFPGNEYPYTPNLQQRVSYRYGQAYLFAKRGKDEKSIEVTNQVLKEAITLKIPSVEADCVQLLSVLYKHIGDYRSALQMLERYNKLEEDEMNVMRRNQVLALGAHYRYAEQEREKLDLKVQAQWSYFIMAVGVIALLIVLILLRESNHKQKIFKLRNTEIEEQISNLLDSLKAEQDQNTNLIRQVEDLKARYHDSQEISELLKTIDQKQITISKYEVLFRNLRPGWKERLKQKVPELTSTDLKYCMCLYFDLDNQAIGRLLNVGSEGIKSAKKRIRDKLSLDDATEIYQYLKKFD